MQTRKQLNIEVKAVSFYRNEKTILDKVSFSAKSGQLLYVKGQNGSGKTTLLKILINLVSPDEGEITFNDVDVRNAPVEFSRECLYIGHRSALKPELSAEENLQFLSKLDGESITDTQGQEALEYFDLSLHSDAQAKSLSAGQQRKTALARLVNSSKSLWVLDEPFTSIDVGSRDKLVKLFESHLDRQGVIITTSHQALNLTEHINQHSVELKAQQYI